jgi:threonine/homoserine/homoserine lactone efflux protein
LGSYQGSFGFPGALTLEWGMMNALTGQLADFLSSPRLTPYVDIVVGITMVGVAAYLVLSKGEHT